jgi:hypothetical protein
MQNKRFSTRCEIYVQDKDQHKDGCKTSFTLKMETADSKEAKR